MSSPTLKFLPELEDLLAAAASAGIAYFQKENPTREATEQILSAIVAENLANYSSLTDSFKSDSMMVQEDDALTGVVRAGYSMSRNRSTKAVMMDGVKGVVCQILGRELKKSVFPSSQ
jgi:hypothetical protein